MSGKAKQSFLHGAIVLGTATIIVKIIGALFKIPLANILGGTGMAYFMTAYDLFNPLYVLSMAGFPVAVSKMVAESVATHRYKDAKRIFKMAFVLFIITGTIGFGIMLLGAKSFSASVENPNAFYSVIAMSPAILFGCIMSSFRGYYQGMSNMYPTAVSQIVEAVVKLIFGISFAYFLLKAGFSLPIAAAGAIVGVSLSTLIGMLYLFGRYKIGGSGISKTQYNSSPNPAERKKILKSLLVIAFPVCLGALVTQLSSLIDLTSIMNMLNHALDENKEIILNMYNGLLPEGISLRDIPVYLYGSYTGLAVSVFALVPALTSTFGISVLPVISSAWAVGDNEKIQKNITSILRITLLIAIPAGIGLFAMSGPILTLLYPNKPAEVAIVTPMLRIMGLSAVFTAIATPVNSILQGLGRVSVPVKLMVIGGIIKLGSNFLLIPNPSINIQGATYGTLLCYVFIVIASLIVLCKTTGLKIHSSLFLKPLFSAILCGVAASTSYDLLSKYRISSINTIIAIGIGGVFYAISIVLLKGITKDEILMLPLGKKIAKTLEKHSIIG